MEKNDCSIEKPDIMDGHARFRSISLSKDDSNWKSVLHTHPFTEIFYVISGKGQFLFLNETCPISFGDLVIIPPYLEHTERSIPDFPLQYYVIGMDGILFRSKEQTIESQFLFNFSHTPFITNLVEQMYYEGKNQGYGSNLICQKLLEILILKITRNQSLTPDHSYARHMSKECAKIKEYLDTHYTEHITLDSLTRLTHMNKFYMVHSFTKYTGMSPIQYLNERRLETARRLLEETDHAMSSIASMVGFSSSSYFAQNFRKKYGITPTEYRQRQENVQKSVT